MGLSQPLDRNQVKAEREAGKSYSSYGFELGFIVPDQCEWPADALYGFMTHITDGVDIKWGDRFAFGFTEQAGGKLGCFSGHPEELGVTPFGNTRAVLFCDTSFRIGVPHQHWKVHGSDSDGITERSGRSPKKRYSPAVIAVVPGLASERSSIANAC